MNKEMSRRYDLDWIRSLIVLSIIFYHSLIIFITREEAIFYVKSGISSMACEYIEAFMTRFHMTVLFFIAGMTVRYSVVNRGIGDFVKNRVFKLLIPAILVIVFLNPFDSFLFGIQKGMNLSYWENYKLFFTTISKGFSGTTPGFSPMHVWFLLFLFTYSIVLIPFFKWGNSDKAGKVFDAIGNFFYKPYRLLLVMIPYPFLFLINILDEMSPIGYFYLFVLGYLFSTSDKYQEAADRDKWGYIIGSTLMMIFFLIGLFIADYRQFSPWLLWIWEYSAKLLRILMIFAILGGGHSWIPKKNSKVLQYINQCNFFVYLIHMAVLGGIGYIVIHIWNMKNLIGFIIINVSSYMICLGLYEIYRRVRSLMKSNTLANKKTQKL